jgi:molybdopterin synthase catalytic subunit
MSEQSTILAQVMTEEITLKATSKAPSLQGRNKAPSDHQLQEAEEEEASEEGSIPNPEGCSVYFVGKIRDIQQGRARSRSRSKKR